MGEICIHIIASNPWWFRDAVNADHFVIYLCSSCYHVHNDILTPSLKVCEQREREREKIREAIMIRYKVMWVILSFGARDQQ